MIARGRDEDALGACRAVVQWAELLVPAHPIVLEIRAFQLHTLARLGDTARAEAALAAMDEQERRYGGIRAAVAALRLAGGGAEVAAAALSPILEEGAAELHPVWATAALLVEAKARDELGDAGAAERALERALDLAEPSALLWPFLLHPAPRLLERHRRQRTVHAALISEILSLLAGKGPAAPPGSEARWGGGRGLPEPLSGSETRVLRYLPTNLSAPEIASELCLSVNTVKTHISHLYDKLGAHCRNEAVEQARALGLLTPS